MTKAWSLTSANQMSLKRIHKIRNSYDSWHIMSHCPIPILCGQRYIVRYHGSKPRHFFDPVSAKIWRVQISK